MIPSPVPEWMLLLILLSYHHQWLEFSRTYRRNQVLLLPFKSRNKVFWCFPHFTVTFFLVNCGNGSLLVARFWTNQLRKCMSLKKLHVSPLLLSCLNGLLMVWSFSLNRDMLEKQPSFGNRHLSLLSVRLFSRNSCNTLLNHLSCVFIISFFVVWYCCYPFHSSCVYDTFLVCN